LRGPVVAQRRDPAVMAVFRATGIRLPELARIVYDPEDAQRSDVDLWRREITVRGKGGKTRIVGISHQTAVSLDRYIPGSGPGMPRHIGRSCGWGSTTGAR
jgi:site-specific recombinase XerC